MSSDQLTKEQINTAREIIVKEFFQAVVALESQVEGAKELTYFKVPVQIPAGGIYLVSIFHVEGSKLDLELLKMISESQTQDNKGEQNEEGNN